MRTAALAVALLLGASLLAVPLHALDYPHAGVNNINCSSCHEPHGEIIAGYFPHTPQNIDDTPTNNLCWSCHNDVRAPYVRTHSSLATSNRHGDWSVECRTCHYAHRQPQFRTYGAESYAYTADATAVTSNTIQRTGAGWTTDQWKGWIVVGNVAYPNYNYQILSNTSDTLTLKGTLNQTYVKAGSPFAIIYGKLIKSTISTPNSGSQAVMFFRNTGEHSFADNDEDGDGVYDGICEVCHTQTTHFRNDGSGPDQHHTNVGGADGRRCTDCHSHRAGFGHGGDQSQGCGTATSCHGTQQAHPTHVGGGPGQLALPCAACHDTTAFPTFTDGQNLAGTTACDTCHSPGGRYDGVNDPAIGAKNNFPTGVYVNGVLRPGKELWCAGCHDEVPAVVQGRTAPTTAPLDAPHREAVSTCERCHATHHDGSAATLDDTLCLSCHDGSTAPLEATHSSLTTSLHYGSWSTQCRTCHEPHQQPQFRTYGGPSALYTGQATAVGSNTIEQTGAGWTPDQWAGWLVLGDVTNPNLSYQIVSNSADALSVAGTLDASITVGSSFAIQYGKLIRSSVTTPNSGAQAVQFFGATGAHSFADGDATRDGICEVCHTQTTHFRNDGSGSDQTHTNVGGASGANCTAACHTHPAGFKHGGGDQGCGTATSCHGTQKSHPTHVNGPLTLDCSACHDTSNMPTFADGQPLGTTVACDTCHSPGGSYDGVNDPAIGAKNNFAAGVYVNGVLRPGKELWCAGCHDEAPAVVHGQTAPSTAPLDAPHREAVSTCERCHATHHDGSAATLDDTLCVSCHDGSTAPLEATHSSLTTSMHYGSWSTQCRTCHEPHQQPQFRSYGGPSALYAGQATAVGSNTLEQTGAGWTPDQWAGLLLLGDVANPNLSYQIVSNSAETLSVAGTLDASITAGSAFAIQYGKLIRSSVTTPNSGAQAVQFFGATGAHSFADGDATHDGICEVCHTQTTHFRNDGSGSDQTHTNVGGASGANCTAACHTHPAGFKHGGGGQGCGTATSCHGTQQSHPTHVGGAPGQLALACAACHDTNNFPGFTDGQNLAGTTACDTCHSPGGSYDGVNDPAIGAKNNFPTGVYVNGVLRPGKELWCAGCHDEVPAVVQGQTAPSTAPLDPPHREAVSTCERCHATHHDGSAATLDDTLCLSCHDGSTAPLEATHSSLTTSLHYGSWSTWCRTCHEPHQQPQFRTYGGPSALYTGQATAVGSTTIEQTGAGWTPDQWAGWLVVGDVTNPNLSYQIVSNSAETLSVAGTLDTSITAGSAFAIQYGKLIRSTVTTPNSGAQAVQFFGAIGAHSFADGDATRDGICEVCHTQTTHFRNDGSGSDQTHTNVGGASGANCTAACHTHPAGFAHGGGGGSGCGGASSCHGLRDSHPTHVGPHLSLQCADCHDTNNFPRFRDGQNLAGTTACNTCHSPGGSYDGVNDPAVGAKNNWPGSVYAAGILKPGKELWCAGCHDEAPSVVQGRTAPNTVGNNSTYGYYATGHGRTTTFAKMSWQAASASGNPGAGQSCTNCHDGSAPHIGDTSKRLRYPNDQDDTVCKQCHEPGGAGAHAPAFYTTSTAYEASAHGGKLCTECHDVHGTAGNFTAMTKGNKESLCYQCHAGHAGHALGATFSQGGQSYTLQCTSCHNVHIVTGMFSAADPDKSPLTRFTNNTAVWGTTPAEKMNAFAGGGVYRTPTGDALSGAQLLDYPTFCLGCHGQDMRPGSIHGNISWGDMHGTAASNSPANSGECPNWHTCGLADGWDGDDCTASDRNTCWPVMTRSFGDSLFSRLPYDHDERIANVNFVLSCNDCHVTHASGSGKLRSTVNGAAYTGEWKTLCNACHYYYNPYHDNMSCGAVNGCHNDNPNNRPMPDPNNNGANSGMDGNTIHGMPMGGHGGGARIFNRDLVLDMRFENTLKDSGNWRLHGKWYSTAGSFASGKVGQAAVLGEDIGVQVGTEDNYWSTDEGNHGTWKYSEMKFNTTLEAWVYPTDNAKSEYTLFRKHTGVSNDGGYGFSLVKINGTLRATFTMAADNNGTTQDGRAGVRGAYSSVTVPLNKWTHVAATFDTNGPDRNPGDPSVGRIRIYVNGEDVTTSDSSGTRMQPGAGETSMYAYSENSPWNQSICYNGSWCASELAIGGFDWETTNYIGRIDEVKLWNITKPVSYFASYDSQTAPYISSVEGLIGSNQLTVRFSEGVYTNTGSSGALVPGDFTLTDTGGNNPRTITPGGVTHTAGSPTATITMTQPLVVADVNADTLAAVTNQIFDNYSNAAGNEAVTISLSSQCPTSPVTLNLNEPSGSPYVMDTQNILYGTVYGGAATLTGSAYSGGGDGSGRYIMFDYNTGCLLATTAMTIETRIKPTGLAGTGNYVRRILSREGSGNYQITVWRNNSAFPGYFNAPSGEASIALWINVVDAHGGNAWKPVLTNYTGAKTGSENNCPIVSDHWYQVKAVWNTNKPGGTPGSFFLPADIFIDDQGTDGNGTGENWSGYLNCTDTDQSLKPDASKFYTADQINSVGGQSFAIGANWTNPANNLFNGLIDWITWKASVD